MTGKEAVARLPEIEGAQQLAALLRGVKELGIVLLLLRRCVLACLHFQAALS
jgi:hypothetical protein